MRSESELIRLYADDVLKACVYYLEDRSDAERAFQETFQLALRQHLFENEANLRVNLFRAVRDVCGSLYFPDEDEDWLYLNYFKLSYEETAAILGKHLSPKFAVQFSS